MNIPEYLIYAVNSEKECSIAADEAKSTADDSILFLDCEDFFTSMVWFLKAL